MYSYVFTQHCIKFGRLWFTICVFPFILNYNPCRPSYLTNITGSVHVHPWSDSFLSVRLIVVVYQEAVDLCQELSVPTLKQALWDPLPTGFLCKEQYCLNW